MRTLLLAACLVWGCSTKGIQFPDGPQGFRPAEPVEIEQPAELAPELAIEPATHERPDAAVEAEQDAAPADAAADPPWKCFAYAGCWMTDASSFPWCYDGRGALCTCPGGDGGSCCWTEKTCN